jgi:hypothetical protein
MAKYDRPAAADKGKGTASDSPPKHKTIKVKGVDWGDRKDEVTEGMLSEILDFISQIANPN